MDIGETTKIFDFSAGHFLPGHNHCGKYHGHNYKLHITVSGKINPLTGFIIDFYDLKKIVEQAVWEVLDHSQEKSGLLNDALDFVPTCENLTVWIWDKIYLNLNCAGVQLKRVRLFETDDSYSDYYGERITN
jgi:6-pyruvoyltetrahydropterin/6-carboxytetrahydropterin synthase